MRDVKISFTIRTNLKNAIIAERLAISLMLRELGVDGIDINGQSYGLERRRRAMQRFSQATDEGDPL